MGKQSISGSFDLYEKFVVKENGSTLELTSAEFKAKYGYTPTRPTRGDYSFGGAYGHTAISTGSAGHTGDKMTHIYSSETFLSQSNGL
tara:strand:+ start:1526 stop:1789 length:264 start_codon:yes stop_codon:yes gene_type:complete